MRQPRAFQDLFKRYRRPGDLVFASGFLVLSLFFLGSIPWQLTWIPGRGLFEQPAFWPSVAIGAMTLFSAVHWFGAVVSERIPGRRAEVITWMRALEFPAWFMAYVLVVPYAGYLLGSILFTCCLAFRLNYRTWRWMLVTAVFAIVVVTVFKAMLQVRMPAGAVYDLLPPGDLRSFLMTRF
jgi:hypothetical protein